MVQIYTCVVYKHIPYIYVSIYIKDTSKTILLCLQIRHEVDIDLTQRCDKILLVMGEREQEN